jgi:tetratricopeptide (TPR) repeat protein
LAGLTLFGIVRRTVLIADRLSATARPVLLALAVALLWTLHPLQTESVTYLSQRTESLAGLCCLLTLYCFIRGAGGGSSWWQAGTVTAGLFGVATKETMACAPVLILLYDRTFVSGTLRSAWRRHCGTYLGLAGTWLLLAWLVSGTHHRGGSAGYGLGVGIWNYGLTQCRAILIYLKLALWPSPLIFDYGTAIAGWTASWPQALAIFLLLAATAWSLVYRPVCGFLAASFFLLLAPSSSFVPVITQTIAEHRVYLPLAAVALLVVLGVERWAGKAGLPLVLLMAAALGIATAHRNRDYRSEQVLWADTTGKCPDNPRAHYNLGVILAKSHQSAAAAEQFEAALRLNPNYADAHEDLGVVLADLRGRLMEAIDHYAAALRLKPDDPEIENNLGIALARVPGRMPEAIAQFERALRRQPSDAAAQYNLANALASTPGETAGAIVHYREALRLKPGNAEAHNNLGIALAHIPGRLPEAIEQYEQAIRLEPDNGDMHNNLGAALGASPGRLREAISEYQQAVQLDPANASAQFNLAQALARFPERVSDAIAHYEAALRLRPADAEAHDNLAQLYASEGRTDLAIGHWQSAIEVDPGDRTARLNLIKFGQGGHFLSP